MPWAGSVTLTHGQALRFDEPHRDAGDVRPEPKQVGAADGPVLRTEREPADATQAEELQRSEAHVEGQELCAAPVERRARRREQHVRRQRCGEPCPQPPLRTGFHQQPRHPGDEVEHRQLVEHLQLEAERAVEGDAAEAHQGQRREGEPDLPRESARPEAHQAGRHDRQAGERVPELRDPRRDGVVLLAPVDARRGDTPEAHRVDRHEEECTRCPPGARRSVRSAACSDRGITSRGRLGPPAPRPGCRARSNRGHSNFECQSPQPGTPSTFQLMRIPRCRLGASQARAPEVAMSTIAPEASPPGSAGPTASGGSKACQRRR